MPLRALAPMGPVIPNRNLMLLAAATATAKAYNRVYLACPLDDLVPDCSPRFIRESSRVLSASLGKVVTVSNALAGETKASALRKALKKGACRQLILLSRSCYAAGQVPCGACSACFKRWVALERNSLTETYDDDPRKMLGLLLSAPGSLGLGAALARLPVLLDVLRALQARGARK